MDVSNTEVDQSGVEVTSRQLLTERFTATWMVSYPLTPHLTIDYTGNLYGPMRLPLLGELDNRAAESPLWSIQNIQLTQHLSNRWTIYAGLKNLLNYHGKPISFAKLGSGGPDIEMSFPPGFNTRREFFSVFRY
jgi:outer membrane receptor for ferrienterochelin and colicins